MWLPDPAPSLNSHENGPESPDLSRKESIELETFESAVEKFLKSAEHLGDGDLPLVVALRETAKTLDSDGVKAPLVNQFRLMVKQLSDTAAVEEVDELEALLDA